MRARISASCLLLLALGCDSASTSSSDASLADGGAPLSDASDTTEPPLTDPPSALPTTLGSAERPATLVVPNAYDGRTPLPVIVALHGYTSTAAQIDLYLQLGAATRREGAYLILPDGMSDSRGAQFWNATPACCDFARSGVDDVGYLRSLLDELEAIAPVDLDRVYFMGHSNGGFMSYRVACELSDRVAAIASLAGSDYADATDCVPEQAVSVLQVHGTADSIVVFAGGSSGFRHPGAEEVVARWAERAGCDMAGASDLAPIDLERSLAGEETSVRSWSAGCEEGHEVELWTMAGASHTPSVHRSFTTDVIRWLLAHER